MTREELIAKVEGLTEPDQEVDSAVDGIACGGKFNFGFLPRYTSSVDAVLALIKERVSGWTVARVSQDDNKLWHAELREGYLTSYNKVIIAPESSRGTPTPALALLAATLRALP